MQRGLPHLPPANLSHPSCEVISALRTHFGGANDTRSNGFDSSLRLSRFLPNFDPTAPTPIFSLASTYMNKNENYVNVRVFGQSQNMKL